jgi:hypothetical protein
MPNIPIFHGENNYNKQIIPTSQQQLPMQKWQQFLSARNQNQSPDTKLIGDIYKELETKLDLQVMKIFSFNIK